MHVRDEVSLSVQIARGMYEHSLSLPLFISLFLFLWHCLHLVESDLNTQLDIGRIDLQRKAGAIKWRRRRRILTTGRFLVRPHNSSYSPIAIHIINIYIYIFFFSNIIATSSCSCELSVTQLRIHHFDVAFRVRVRVCVRVYMYTIISRFCFFRWLNLRR